MMGKSGEYLIGNKSYQKHRFAKRRLKAILLMGGECQKCEFKPKALVEYAIFEIHHPKGNKEKEHHLMAAANILRGNSSDYVLLCANCHIIANINDRTRTSWIGNLIDDDFNDILQGEDITRKYIHSGKFKKHYER
ncbi:MAG: hypothetical protein ACE5OZ_17330 [Candidatus Heimdallarchaeota archaeon]